MEINYTFRRLPSASTLENWVEQTPAGLRLRGEGEHADHAHPAAEECRRSHRAFLQDDRPAAHVAAAGADPVPVAAGDEVRRRAAARLSGTAARATCGMPSNSAMPVWLVEEVYDVLRARNVSLCVAESEKLEVPEVITADFVYYRLRKPDYTAEDVDAIAARSKELLATGRDLYLMFKHEETPEGALNAETVLRKANS